ncbi:MAG: CvpA family protein [Anaerolineae bacterium]|nr:CvpA family protein [Anaerolineae bacterium]
MVPLNTFFLGLVILFGLIGALRGWAKELLVTFSVVLARFIEFVALVYVPVLSTALQSLQQADPKTWFYVRLMIFGLLVSFGYATTVISTRLGQRARKEKLQDTLLGLFLGGINGFLVIGSVWGFLHEIQYGIWGITGPTTEAAQNLIQYLPTAWLQGPALFVGVAVSFAFVLIVFV